MEIGPNSDLRSTRYQLFGGRGIGYEWKLKFQPRRIDQSKSDIDLFSLLHFERPIAAQRLGLTFRRDLAGCAVEQTLRLYLLYKLG
jgi:hypothetical protein